MAELNKIIIDGVEYDLPTGGSGGSGSSEPKLVHTETKTYEQGSVFDLNLYITGYTPTHENLKVEIILKQDGGEAITVFNKFNTVGLNTGSEKILAFNSIIEGAILNISAPVLRRCIILQQLDGCLLGVSEYTITDQRLSVKPVTLDTSNSGCTLTVNIYEIPTGGSGGASSVFEDVAVLPENPSEDVIYRLLKVDGIYDGIIQTDTTVHVVDTLPTTGNVCTSDGSNLTDMYYNKSDNNVYGYVNDMIGSAFGIPAGWYSAEMLLGVAGMSYGGVVGSIDQADTMDTYYFILTYQLYVYKTDWISLNPIGWLGSGDNSTIFNSYSNIASGNYSHAEGKETAASGVDSHAEGFYTEASGDSSHAEGEYTIASGVFSHAEGYSTEALGEQSHAEGFDTTASNTSSHAEGATTTASGIVSHAEGAITTASGDYSHAEGHSTKASGMYSHSEGYKTTASGEDSHAEGNGTVASSYDCHAEGYNTEASGSTAHAEGCNTVASGDNSHAEGYKTVASGADSHTEGYDTKALGTCAHAEGYSTIASSNASHAEGKFNIEDTNKKYAHIVGNGSSDKARSNAHTLDWDGNAWFKGKVRVGGNSWDEGTELGAGTGGSSSVFEDVITVPESPDSNKIYRVNNAEVGLYVFDGENLLNFGEAIKAQNGSLEIIRVSELPENPKSSDMSTMTAVFYVVGQDLYSYNITGNNTWLSNNELATAMELLGYGGVISNLDPSGKQELYMYLHIINSYSYINIVNGEQFEFANNKGKLIYEDTIENDNKDIISLGQSVIYSCEKLYLEIEIDNGAIISKINAESICKTELSDSSGTMVEYNFIISYFSTSFCMCLFTQMSTELGCPVMYLSMKGGIINDNTVYATILENTLTIRLYKMK